MIQSIRGGEGENIGENEWWGRGSFKTRDMYQETGKDLKRGLVVMGVEQGTGQASSSEKCKKKVLVVFN